MPAPSFEELHASGGCWTGGSASRPRTPRSGKRHCVTETSLSARLAQRRGRVKGDRSRVSLRPQGRERAVRRGEMDR